MNILLVVYDNDSYIHQFPTGLGYIAAVLKRAGHEVTIFSQDKEHYPDEHLTAYLDNNHFDVIGVSVIAGYYQYRKLLKLSQAINSSRNRPFYVLGGHGPAPEAEFFMRKTGCDVIVIGEGEETVVELMDAIGKPGQIANIKGIVWRDGDRIVSNERRPLIQEVDTIPFPAYELFPMDYYRLMRDVGTENSEFCIPILSGRGCLFTCNFCFRLDPGFRPRQGQAILEEIKLLQKDYHINMFSFNDELLMSSVDRATELCEEFIQSGLKFKWSCNGRLNFAKPDLLHLMKRAGCVFINYGIEAMDDKVLRNMRKALTTDIIIRGIEATLSAGIVPGYNIIFGNIGETRETLMKGVEFLLKYDVCGQLRTIRPVTPYPGSPLYYHAIEKGLLKDCEDFYEHKHVNSDLLSINFTDLSEDEFHTALFEANKILLQNYFKKRAEAAIQQAADLYLGGNVNFRGFRQT